MDISNSFQKLPFAAPIVPAKSIPAFLPGKYKTVREFWDGGLNPDFWTHGIVISQGNGMSVSPRQAAQRLNSIGRPLLREIFGNHWRDKANITFLVFQHGGYETYNQHFHALIHIDGEHNWSNFRIAMRIKSIDFMRHMLPEEAAAWEKKLHVDWNWTNENRYHGYVSRFANGRPDTWCYQKIIEN
jgi:hypothetical protein